jgi:4-amino-4-deoxy-L-arabinose transferase-like glycosyltransferase
MDKKNYLRGELYFWFITAGIFLILISRAFLSEGMFMDGMLYATMSKNQAAGLGSFWSPHMTDTFFPVFHNHPPLAFKLESIFFMILGESRFTEKIYSVLAIMITAFIISRIWQTALKKEKGSWLPVFFWVLVPSVTWSAVNNMLENTLDIFICLSVLFYLKSIDGKRYLLLLLSGLMLSLGFLTKGFVTFFPFSFPFILWMCTRHRRFIPMAADTLVMLAASLSGLAIAYGAFPGGREALPEYLRVVSELALGAATKSTRFYILGRLAGDLLPVLIITGLVFVFLARKSRQVIQVKSAGMPVAFLLLGLTGALPLMITRVQSGYYILPSIPFFVISFAMLVYPAIESSLERIVSKHHGILRTAGMVLIVSGVVLADLFSGKPNRDKELISDMKLITSVVPGNDIVGILPDMSGNWPLHCYYARFHNISLDPVQENRHDFLIADRSMVVDSTYRSYEKTELKTSRFDLYRLTTGSNQK